MAESMTGFKRDHYCAEVEVNEIDKVVTLTGWVQKRRNLGSLIFIDLRDRTGLIQLVFDEDVCGSEVFKKAESLRSEFVLATTGIVKKRSAAVNENLKTGEIEVFVEKMAILSEAQTPPFPIEADSHTKDEIRLKYRYLDLRRPDLASNIMMRSRVVNSIRNFLIDEGFLEIETPILQKSTPEGARDYLVPSRVHPGNFYALPQSPQLFKQLLMCSGFDRYFQVAKCFRDEDLRADRQPEFTQIDLEMSFADVDDVIDVNERLLAKVFKDNLGVDVALPIQRMTWHNAMNKYGSDKPDIRFEMYLTDVSDEVKDCGFGVFTGALENGGCVKGLCVKGQGSLGRKQIDKLVDFVKDYGAKGLAYLGIAEDGTIKSSFTKFLSEDETSNLIKAMGAENGDLLLFAADSFKVVCDSLGALRVKLGNDLGLFDPKEFAFLWVVDFPQFEYSEEQGRYLAMHHPFTAPFDEDIDKLGSDLASVRAKAYDIVLNGCELGGGSIRIHQPDVQEKMFEALGFSKEEAHDRFGFLLDAFEYGVPPHAGLAFGLDRMIMLMVGADSIRDVIAFPKVKDASDLMCEAPNVVDDKQLEELALKIDLPESE